MAKKEREKEKKRKERKGGKEKTKEIKEKSKVQIFAIDSLWGFDADTGWYKVTRSQYNLTLQGYDYLNYNTVL